MSKVKARTSKYPWHRWSEDLEDGQAWKVSRHVDYRCKSQSFAGMVYKEARMRGLKATVVIFPGFVVFRFFDGNGYMMPNMKAFPIVKTLMKRHGRKK